MTGEKMSDKVLILDDNADIRKIIAEMVKRSLKLETIDSEDPAVILVSYEKGDVVLFDLNMPGIDTEGFVDFLFALDPDVVCAVLTGNPESSKIPKLKEKRVSDFIFKPCPLSLLIKKIEDLRQKRNNP